MLKEFDRLAEVLKDRAEGKSIVFLPNPGNFGDGLIRYGAKKFMFDHDIEHFELNLGGGRMKYLLGAFLARPRKYFYVYCGSGAFAAHYAYAHRACRLISTFTNDLLVMPSTFGFPLSRVGGTIFRRDDGESKKNCPDSIFCHDMALYLLAKGQKYDFPGVEKKATGNFFRTDREASNRYQDIPENFDLSVIGDHMSPIDEFLSRIAGYDVIKTDRLHVGIGGAILGKEVHLYTSNYFKIRAIYESSLSHLPNVVFKGDAPFQE